jgi:Adaptin N terminal region
VILKNLDFIIQKYGGLFTDVKLFFCKYSDLPFVKTEKMNILLRLTDSKNADNVLNELSEYSNDLDPEFSRKAIQCIWKIALRLESVVDKCIGLYYRMVCEYQPENTSYHVCELSIGVSCIVRRYPQPSGSTKYHNLVKKIVEFIPSLLEPKARIAAIWLLGEFASVIPSVPDLLTKLYTNFMDDELEVQMQILTSATKCYLDYSDNDKVFEIIQGILKQTTENCENPDLRDKAFIYWRLLALEKVDMMKKVLLAERPQTLFPSEDFEKPFLKKLLANIGAVSSIYHSAPEALFPKLYQMKARLEANEDEDSDQGEEFVNVERGDLEIEDKKESSSPVSKKPAGPQKTINLLEDEGLVAPQEKPSRNGVSPKPAPAAQKKAEVNLLDDEDLLGGHSNPSPSSGVKAAPIPSTGFDLDLLSLGGPSQPPSTGAQVANGGHFGATDHRKDLFESDDDGSHKKGTTINVPFEVILKRETKGQKGQSGVEIEANVCREGGTPQMNMLVRNHSGQTLTDIKVVMRANKLGLIIEKSDLAKLSIGSGTSQMIKFRLVSSQKKEEKGQLKMPFTFEVGFACSLDRFVMQLPVYFHSLLVSHFENY